MTEPIPNLPLLRKILDHIDAHPEEWDQRWFFASPDEDAHVLRMAGYNPSMCGTTMCVAGWASEFERGFVDAPGAEDSADFAQHALGLTANEADALFYGTAGSLALPLGQAKSTQRAAVQVVAERIAARAGEVL